MRPRIRTPSGFLIQLIPKADEAAPPPPANVLKNWTYKSQHSHSGYWTLTLRGTGSHGREWNGAGGEDWSRGREDAVARQLDAREPEIAGKEDLDRREFLFGRPFFCSDLHALFAHEVLFRFVGRGG